MFKGLIKSLLGQRNTIDLQAPCQGKYIPLPEVADPVFSGGMMGKGMAVKPSGNIVYAPCDAKITQVFPSKHALTLEGNGAEVLIHIGIDTVKLQGKHFKSLVSTGDVVKAGQALIEFDLEEIAKEYDPTVIMVVANSDEFSKIEVGSESVLNKTTVVIKLEK